MFALRSYGPWTAPFLAGLLALGALPPDQSGRAHTASAAPVRDDFDGDGYQDLAVGAAKATVGGRRGAGYVVVLYGGPHGLSATRRTVISRATPGIPDDPVQDEGFGTQLAKGDLNGDGYADLVAGVAARGREAVVVWGGRGGLTTGTPVPATNTQTGDFDGDGRLDLALFRTGRSPGDDPLGTQAQLWTGPVSRSGRPTRSAALDPGHLKYHDVVDGAVGDVNRDGRDDLALRVYCGDGGFCTQFYLASGGGLTRVDPVTVPAGGDAVALGDVNGDGYDDIVAGHAWDSTIEVAYGSAAGVRPKATWKTYSQDTPGVPGTKEDNNGFGDSLAVGDVNGDGVDDVAVGVPAQQRGYDDSVGAVDILRGSRGGLTGTGAQALTQDTPGVPGTAEQGDGFGNPVRLLDINGNGYADLAAAALGEDEDNGAVWVLRGRPSGIVTDAALVVGGRTLGTPYAKAGFGTVVR